MRKNQILRLKNIIENDRLDAIESFSNLFVNDLRSVISEYFSIKGDVLLNIKREKGAMRVEIIVETTQIKNFLNIQ